MHNQDGTHEICFYRFDFDFEANQKRAKREWSKPGCMYRDFVRR